MSHGDDASGAVRGARRPTAGDTARSAGTLAWERIGAQLVTVATTYDVSARAATLPGAVVLLGGPRG